VQAFRAEAAQEGVAADQSVAGALAAEFVLRRNCSLSPRGLMAVFGSLVVLSLAFGVGFAALGAWLILPFAGVELLALAAAFVVYGVHAADGERVRVAGDLLTVEVTDGRTLEVHEFPARWVRLVRREDQPGAGLARGWRLLLVCRGRALEVGRHLSVHRRTGFEQDLRVALERAARVA